MKVSSLAASSEQLFRNELDVVLDWLERRKPHQQPAVLVSMIHKLEPISNRFLFRLLESMTNQEKQLLQLEQEANDIAFVEHLCSQPKEAAISQTLRYVPLLLPDNDAAKYLYMNLIPQLCDYALRSGRCLEECNQLMSYCIVHPGLEVTERAQLKPYAQRLQSDLTKAALESGCNGSNSTTTNNGHLNGHSPAVRNGHAPVNRTNGHHHHPSVNGLNGHQSSNGVNGCGSHGLNCPPPPLIGSCVSPPHLNTNGHSSLTNGNGHLLHQQHLHLNGGQSSTGYGVVGGNVAIINGSRLEECWMDRAVGGPQGCGQFEPTPCLKSMQPSNGYTDSLFPDSSSMGVGNPFNGSLMLGDLSSRARRSNSLTPPSTGMNHTLVDDVDFLCIKQRSMSLSSEHAPLSPQSSLASSGSNSEGHLDKGRNSFSEQGSGMKDVPAWLKKLRLHKYEDIFKQMDFNEMLTLTENKLEKLGVTKGARRKIFTNIQELLARQDLLKSMEMNMSADRECIRNALSELKKVMDTPLNAFQSSLDLEQNQPLLDGDLPGQILRVVSKVCNYLVRGHYEDECSSQCNLLLERCMNHDAFSEVQKKKLRSLQQQVHRLCPSLPPRRGSDVRHNRGRLTGQTSNFPDFNLSCLGSGGWPNLANRRVSSPAYSTNLFGGSGSPSPIGNHLSQHAMPPLHYPNLFSKRGSLQEMNSHSALSRTKSAPANPKIPCENSDNDCAMETTQRVLDYAFGGDERY